MKTRYDAKVDALAIDLRPRARSVKTVRVTREIAVDFDRQGRAVSIEILNASRHLSPDALKELPSARVMLTLTEAAARATSSGHPLSPVTLRRQLSAGRIKGEKRGRDWTVSAAELETYLEAVEARAERADARRRSA
jgi:uncharacterized protein YuzE